MPDITILPHKRLCPKGKTIAGRPGDKLCNLLLANDVFIENACENSCACATCHVIVREGYRSLAAASDKEEDMLDQAWGLSPQSRLACQTVLGDTDLVIEIPKYTVNLAREGN